MDMPNQIFLPASANNPNEIKNAIQMQTPLVNAGYKRGLMLVIKSGRRGVTLDTAVREQYSNLAILTDYKSPIIVMLSNMPIEEMDLLHNPTYSLEHLMRGADFLKRLPIGTRKIMTFHLNTLITEEEFEIRSKTGWMNEFDRKIRPLLKVLAAYAKNKGVEAKVETTPVPEFGDIDFTDERTYRGAKLNELRNPFYLTGYWGFEQIYNAGLGICLDVCHNRTIYELARAGDPDNALHKADLEELAKRSLIDDVKALKATDIVHLNDGEGLYSKENQTVHNEGVSLGKGDTHNLRGLIYHLDKRGIPYVLELSEIDFKTMPNTKASIQYLLQKIGV